MPSLATLDPAFQPVAQRFFRWARDIAGSGLVVTSARRTHLEQLRLYQAFLRGENNGLPALPPGNSDHELGLAFDMARMNIDPLHDRLLWDFGKAWQSIGGRWWKGDPVHFSAGKLLGR